MRFSPGQVSSRGHDSRGGNDVVGVATGCDVGFRVGRRVGFLVGGRDGLGVGLGGLVPLKMVNDTRYAVSARPLTLAVTVWAPARRFAH
jgi:hypothetical protein